jgi:hypothetical protein
MILGVTAQFLLIIIISSVSPRIDSNGHVVLTEEQEMVEDNSSENK